jgi:hypothetical protein
MSTYPINSAGTPLERLHQSVEVLCTGVGDVRSRLRIAVPIILPLRPDDFPVEYQQEFQKIIAESTKHANKENQSNGAIAETMRKIQNKTGSKIAVRILICIRKCVLVIRNMLSRRAPTNSSIFWAMLIRS